MRSAYGEGGDLQGKCANSTCNPKKSIRTRQQCTTPRKHAHARHDTRARAKAQKVARPKQPKWDRHKEAKRNRVHPRHVRAHDRASVIHDHAQARNVRGRVHARRRVRRGSCASSERTLCAREGDRVSCVVVGVMAPIRGCRSNVFQRCVTRRLLRFSL